MRQPFGLLFFRRILCPSSSKFGLDTAEHGRTFQNLGDLNSTPDPSPLGQRNTPADAEQRRQQRALPGPDEPDDGCEPARPGEHARAGRELEALEGHGEVVGGRKVLPGLPSGRAEMPIFSYESVKSF